MRPRYLLFGLACGADRRRISFVLSLADGLLVDLMWFTALGYRSIFTVTLLAEVTIFAIAWLFTFSAIALSGLIALRLSHERERLRVVRRPEQMAEVNLPEIIRALGDPPCRGA